MNPKAAKDHLPYFDDQGIPYPAGAGKAGVSIQHKPNWAMISGGVFVFADQGLEDMADGNYSVIIQNQTDAADEATVAAAAKTTTQITIVGPDVADVLDIVIVGRLKNQVSA